MKILIVDDDAKNRKLLKVALRNYGYETIEAENGYRAVISAKEHMPALILMDIQMPVMDGISALNTIRADESMKDVPVIAVTSYAMKGDLEKFISEGFDSCMTKPIDIKKLMGLVEKFIKGSE
ncbi:MAG: response regulator [Nitrospirae bacterium]|nr:response regulator [Nitrospirota bacterium]